MDRAHRGGEWRSRTWFLGLLVCLALLAVACRGEGTEEAASEPPGDPAAAVGLGVPALPSPTEPFTPAGPPDDDAGDPAAAAAMATDPPQAGDTVLLHLEGPLSDRAATDVVIRNEDGEEVDRFRLPGAVSAWAAPGASTALLYTLPGGWARYDAITDTLALVSFPGEVPGPTIQPGSGIAGPTALWDPQDTRWMLRMDTGEVTDLAPIAEQGTLVTLGRGGAHAVIRRQDGSLTLLRTRSAGPQSLAASAAAISDDGMLLATVDPEGLVTVSALEGTDLRVVGRAEPGVRPVALSDGRVLLTGDEPALLGGVDGLDSQPIQPPIPISYPIRVSADSTMALATGVDGLILLDLTALTATPVTDSAGYVPLPIGTPTVLWAASQDPTQPGALVVDPATRAVTPLLADTPTVRFTSISADGRRVGMALADVSAAGASDSTASRAVVVDADGTVTPVGADGSRSSVVLHPGGALVAVAMIEGSQRHLEIGPLDGERLQVDTGRNPVWLQRVSPSPVQARPGGSG